LALLLVFGLVLAGGNIWVVAARSTIPLALNAQVTEKELRHEKHPGRDDVCLVQLNNGLTLHVDQSVFAKVTVGDSIRKSAWSNKLTVDGQETLLAWSPDFYGMTVAMPAIMVVMFLTAILKLPTGEVDV
jgi:hypothetical protein